MLEEVIKKLASDLHQAEKARVPIAPLTTRYPELTIADGYRISREWVDMKRSEGRVARGLKIGLTSQAMRQVAGINDCDYGTLLDDMFFEEGGDIPVSRFIAPRVEAELAFVLARPLKGPGITIVDVLRATEYVIPAIEIIDSRVLRHDPETKALRTIKDNIADNAANAGVVMGGRPVRPDDFDMRWAGVMLSRNGVIEETGLGAGVLNHPANGIVWLANRIGQWGEQLEAGQVLLGGSFIRPVSVSSGDAFHADYGRLGSIGFRFI